MILCMNTHNHMLNKTVVKVDVIVCNYKIHATDPITYLGLQCL